MGIPWITSLTLLLIEREATVKVTISVYIILSQWHIPFLLLVILCFTVEIYSYTSIAQLPNEFHEWRQVSPLNSHKFSMSNVPSHLCRGRKWVVQ